MILVLLTIIKLLEFILFVRIVLSWLRLENSHIITEKISFYVDMVLLPIKKVLPHNSFGIDFSPIIIFLGLHIIRELIIKITLG